MEIILNPDWQMVIYVSTDALCVRQRM